MEVLRPMGLRDPEDHGAVEVLGTMGLGDPEDHGAVEVLRPMGLGGVEDREFRAGDPSIIALIVSISSYF